MFGIKYFWQKVRFKLFRLAKRVILGPVAGTIPDHWIKQVAGGYFRPVMQQHLMQHIEVLPPTLDSYTFPDRYPISFRRTKAFDARHVFVFQNVCVSPSSAVAYVPPNWVLEESAGALEKVSGWGRIMPELLLGTYHLPVTEPVVVVPSAPFYHFIWEHLPAIIQALELEPEAHLLLPEPCPRYVSDALDLLLEGKWRNRAHFARKICQVHTLLVPQIETHSGFIHPAYPALLQKAFGHSLEGVEPAAEKIYVSRRFAPGRHMRFEQELENSLAAQGFAILYLERMTLREQFQAFRRASVVVAPHGAGLSHLHFAASGSYVLECFPFGYFNDCYARLSVQCGHTYDYVVCRPDSAWEGGAMPVESIVVRVNERMRKAERSETATLIG